MAYSSNCPYALLSEKPCWTCPHHIADTDECSLSYLATATRNNSKNIDTVSYTAKSQSYEERRRDYEKKRQEYLQLSKEALVDLIIQRPSFY